MQRSGVGVLRWAWAGCLMAPCYNTVRSIPNTFVERSSTLVTGYRCWGVLNIAVTNDALSSAGEPAPPNSRRGRREMYRYC